MRHPEWGPPTDPETDDGLTGPHRFAVRELAALLPVRERQEEGAEDATETETVSVQEDESGAEPPALSTDDEPGGPVSLASRLEDHRALAPHWGSFLTDYTNYEKAVLLGFAPFDYRSHSEFFNQAYMAIYQRDPGEGSRGGNGCSVQTSGTVTYTLTDTSEGPKTTRTVEVKDSAQPRAELYIKDEKSSGGRLRVCTHVSLPQYGIYSMTATRDMLVVEISPFFEVNPVFEYVRQRGFPLRTHGLIPLWRGSDWLSNP